ncbi:hypothetical protein HK44_020415 [Pseudomonas fluorescens HK44]|uniref:Uncharacterized protein n=1 Tax=Pseudomonas fluorescens HK44 TaxID=1042209 RepID=A0A010S745_PSEFL|nr:hypothetical protein [Pseudomonas fluorescens]EXF96274.1 hypothetical protein HK44_020415 [Pseudomonas fluorescens HK44]
MQEALRDCQARYDNMLPPEDEEAPVDEQDVAEWKKAAIEDLMDQGSAYAPNPWGRERELVRHKDLVRSVVTHMEAQLDQECGIEKILIEIVRRGHTDDHLYKWAVSALGPHQGEGTVIHALADALVESKVDEYIEAKREADHEKRRCGF